MVLIELNLWLCVLKLRIVTIERVKFVSHNIEDTCVLSVTFATF